MLKWFRKTFQKKEGKSQSKPTLMMMESQHSEFVICDEQANLDFSFLSDDQWERIMKDGTRSHNQLRITLTIIKGLDPKRRRYIWNSMANVDKLKSSYPSDYYKKMAKKQPAKEVLRQIELDLPRTFCTADIKEQFNRKEDSEEIKAQLIPLLKNILLAYANVDIEIGYTQGMNFFVSNLMVILLYNHYNELDQLLQEEIFWILHYAMLELDYRSMFCEGMPGMFELLNKLEQTIRNHYPQLLEFLTKWGVDLYCLFSGCYMTLFQYVNPSFQMGSRITDMFLLIGPPILNSLILRMLENSLENLYKLESIEQVSSFFKEVLVMKMDCLLEQELTHPQKLKNSGFSPWKITQIN